MHLTVREQQTLAEFKDGLARCLGDRLAGLILFGSKARGEAGPDSDIDVLVLVHGEADEAIFRRVSDLAYAFVETHNVWPHALVESVEEWESERGQRRWLAQFVREEGVAL